MPYLTHYVSLRPSLLVPTPAGTGATVVLGAMAYVLALLLSCLHLPMPRRVLLPHPQLPAMGDGNLFFVTGVSEASQHSDTQSPRTTYESGSDCTNEMVF